MAAVLACVVRSAAQTHVWMSGSVLSSAIVDASEADARASEPSNEPLTNFADRERKLSRPKRIVHNRDYFLGKSPVGPAQMGDLSCLERMGPQ